MSTLLKRLLKQSTFMADEPGAAGGGEPELETPEKDDESDVLGMSDEDFLKAGPPVETPPVVAETQIDENTDLDPDNPDQGDGLIDNKASDTDPGTEPGKTEGAEEASADAGKPEGAAGDEDKDKTKPEAGKDNKKPETTDVVDYKAAYEKLTAPFKAIGKEFSVKDVDEAIQLMQMGVGFNKRMAALKPSLKMLKLLENHGLLNEEKLSFLIDLDRKDPAAINKLVQDSKIDPMDLSAEKASEYRQTTRSVNDSEVDLDMVLADLKESPSYNQTLTVATQWDDKSKKVLAEVPHLLKVIHGHIESGAFTLISAEVEKQRAFGNLTGLSDLEAYRQVGDAIHARGGFNHLAPATAAAQKETTTPPKIVTPNPTKVEDAKLNDKRRAASPTRPAAPSSAKAAEINPLEMSDAEFEKQVNAKFL